MLKLRYGDNMEKNLKKIELFFKYNLAIKNSLVKLTPNLSDDYNTESRMH